MKALAIIGLLFLFYCLMQLAAKGRFYNGAHALLWILILVAGGWWCVSTLIR